jgi:hypothetical protein
VSEPEFVRVPFDCSTIGEYVFVQSVTYVIDHVACGIPGISLWKLKV